MKFKNEDEFYTFANNYTRRSHRFESGLEQVAKDIDSFEWSKDMLFMLIYTLQKKKLLTKKDLKKIFYSVPKDEK